jgi:hypothetical protein
MCIYIHTYVYVCIYCVYTYIHMYMYMPEIDPISFVEWISDYYIVLICIHEYSFCLIFDLLLRIMCIVICGAILLTSCFLDYCICQLIFFWYEIV